MAYRSVPAVGLYWLSDLDPTIAPGVPAPLYQLLIRTDSPALYYKSGQATTAWTLLGSGVAPPPFTLTSFRKVLTGAEGDTVSVVLPAAWPNTNYNPFVMLLRPLANSIEDVTVLDGSITVNGFDVQLGAPAEAGSALMVVIVAM